MTPLQKAILLLTCCYSDAAGKFLLYRKLPGWYNYIR